MLLALEHVFTENIETAQIAQNSEIFQKNWKKVEPEALDILFRTFNFTPDEKEIYEYAAELWESNSWRSSLYLASKFNFSIQFENQFSVIETLVEGYYFNSIPTFISNNNNLLQKCIEVMSKYKCYKEAGKIVEIAGYDINDYPLLIEGQWVSSMTYFLNFDNIGIYQLISIISNTPFLLASAAEKLFQSNKSINSWQSKIAAGIAQQFPTCPIRSEIREMLKSIAPRPISLQCDSFSPLQPEFEIAFPLPRDTIHFIDTPEALANVFFTGQIIGLDCEWRSELFKYKNYKVSIIQIACEDIVYLIDLIALNTNPELDEKLTSLMQSDAYKVGVSFEGDILKLNSSYPHLSAFKNPIKNYIDLVRAHVKRFGNNPRGLAGCCELVLKKSLCKYEQRSNWENRPLTESQTHYAALDAYIQIMILKKLMKSPKFDIKRAFGGQMSRKKMPHSKILGCDLCGSKQHEKNCCKRGKRCKICFMTGHKPINCIR